MTDLEQIAASVAKALELTGNVWVDQQGVALWKNGSNLFDPHWQVRCRDWLLEKGYGVSFDTAELSQHALWEGPDETLITCHAWEFCARAIHALIVGGYVGDDDE